MRDRCYYKKHMAFKNYGGRGITVCDEWLQNFETFYKWAIQNGYEDHLTLDRIDNDGNYEPSNCRWITYREQCLNKRRTSNTGVVGVSYIKTKNRYDANIYIEGKLRHLGYTKTLQEAVTLRRQAESALCNQTI